MPAVKMVAKSPITCKRNGKYPRVSHKSNRICNKVCKRSCLMVGVTNEVENLDLSSQISCNDGFFVNKDSSKEGDNEEHQMPSNIDAYEGQNGLSVNGCAESVVETQDSFPVSVPAISDSDALLAYFNRPDDNLFDGVNGEEINTLPGQVDANNFSNFQTPDMLELYMDEACLDGFCFDGVNLFDDSLYYNILNDLEFFETNMIYDLPALEDTIGVANFQYVESSEEVHKQIPDSSWFNSICHQAKPVTEELDVRSCQFESGRIDYADQELLIKNFLEVSDESNLLPALVSRETSRTKRVTLVLDLDETLIHSTMTQYDSGADFTVQILLDKEYTVYVRKRPFLHEFLERVSKMFEIFIFTASKKIYAEKLLDVLDPEKKIFSHRAYRDSCIFQDGTYTKDLTVLGIDLAKVAIVDNSPQVFRLQVNNGIPIESWFDDPSDFALMSLLPFLEKLVDVDDVRPVIAEKFGNKF
ncbi:uncharacterized protein LOC131593409 isoform X1 [Vicia villosa]|uniref:uncharacterized protein LOC131593409 isoform X1 n=1 Tax=Vicia villosa TaxID=3911 RepID=UPI00273CB918|nr:uncharacterized protein LOC131593409 isoform X1 [Vicia villosa]XP_058721889.1 uncharacterized protein LOC131593409 isoform X1 [Vicia villosa]